MIVRLTLHNFGPFADYTIFFSKLTRIKGDNSVGKSHIVDALQIALLSKAFPDTYIKHGAEEASVEVELSSGVIIKRVRDKVAQYVHIHEPEQEPKKYTNPLKMAEEVSRVTRFSSKKIDAQTTVDLQFLPIESDQFFMVQGVSAPVVLRRITNLITGSDLSHSKKGIQDSYKEIEAVLKYNRRIIKESGSKFTDNFGECLSIKTEQLENLGKLKEDIIAKKKSLAVLESALGAVRVYPSTLDEYITAGPRTTLLTLEKKTEELRKLVAQLIDIQKYEKDLKLLITERNTLEKDLLDAGLLCKECGKLNIDD